MILLFIILLFIILFISLYANYNQLKNYERIESETEFLLKNLGEKDIWIEEFSLKIEEIDKNIQLLDKRGSFSSDDEIGFFFKEVQKFTNDLVVLKSKIYKEESPDVEKS